MSTRRALAAVSGLVLALVAGVARAAPSPYNLPEGVTPISHWVYALHMRTFWICVGIFVVVMAVMFYSIIFHRKSRGAVAGNFHESMAIELAWTIAPFVILIIMAVPAAKVLLQMEDYSKPALSIKVTGYQWLWHYNYVDNGVSFYSKLAKATEERRALGANIRPATDPHYLRDVDHPMVVPTGKKIRLLITSGDVIHSWWVPDFGAKTDAIPGYINQMWIKVEKPGIYRGQCAELCGRDHAYMPIVVDARSPADFRAWLKAHGGHPATGPEQGAATINRGRQPAPAQPSTTTTPPPAGGVR